MDMIFMLMRVDCAWESGILRGSVRARRDGMCGTSGTYYNYNKGVYIPAMVNKIINKGLIFFHFFRTVVGEKRSLQ
jgi:hypothetical protein